MRSTVSPLNGAAVRRINLGPYLALAASAFSGRNVGHVIGYDGRNNNTKNTWQGQIAKSSVDYASAPNVCTNGRCAARSSAVTCGGNGCGRTQRDKLTFRGMADGIHWLLAAPQRLPPTLS
jgi:hypothetical protein